MPSLENEISASNLFASSDAMSTPFSAKSLTDLAIGQNSFVQKVVPSLESPEWVGQLNDLGFIPGEPVTVLARGALGGDPLVVRIGLSTFALRKAEAACVIVTGLSLEPTA